MSESPQTTTAKVHDPLCLLLHSYIAHLVFTKMDFLDDLIPALFTIRYYIT